MSLSVTTLSLFHRVTGFVAGANPSCLQAKAEYTLDKSPAHRREQFGGSVSCSRTLAAQLSPGEPGFEPATNPATPSTSWPALPTELQQPLILEYSWFNLTIFSAGSYTIVGLRHFCHDDCHLYLRTILCSKDGGNQTKPVRLYPGVFCGFGIDRIKKYSLKIKIQELNWKKKPSVIPQQATEDKNLVCHKVN